MSLIRDTSHLAVNDHYGQVLEDWQSNIDLHPVLGPNLGGGFSGSFLGSGVGRVGGGLTPPVTHALDGYPITFPQVRQDFAFDFTTQHRVPFGTPNAAVEGHIDDVSGGYGDSMGHGALIRPDHDVLPRELGGLGIATLEAALSPL